MCTEPTIVELFRHGLAMSFWNQNKFIFRIFGQPFVNTKDYNIWSNVLEWLSAKHLSGDFTSPWICFSVLDIITWRVISYVQRYYHVESYQLRVTILSSGELSVTYNDIITWRIISYVQRIPLYRNKMRLVDRHHTTEINVTLSKWHDTLYNLVLLLT